MRFLMAALSASFILSGAATSARDLALIVDQQDYRYLPDLPKDRRLQALAQDLGQAGFEVVHLKDAGLGALRAALFSTQTAAQSDPGRLLILLRGHVVHDGHQSWLIAQDARTPDGFDIGSKAVSFSAMNSALHTAAGRALLAIVTDPVPLRNLADLSAQTQSPTVPQGVTALVGSENDVQVVISQLLKPGMTTQEVANNAGAAQLTGFLSRSVAFTAVASSSGPQPTQDIGELAYWSAVRDIGTPQALEAYMNRYPNGIFTTEARDLFAGRIADQQAQFQQAEQALGLTRNSRRDIQRDLNLLGYNTRGIDGVFGPATRRAMAAWQSDQGLEAHGYFDREQLLLMREFARIRAAEREEEARRQRAIEDARDRAFWQGTGAGGSEAGFRSYLNEFPNGVYSDLARTRIEDIEAARRAQIDAQERSAWETADSENTIAAYRQFLGDFPDGLFAETANARIQSLQPNPSDQELREKYLRAERSVAGSGAARLLIESRLVGRGLDPGDVDGEFTQQTRNALRRFQSARNLQPTGYVDQATMVQLLLGR